MTELLHESLRYAGIPTPTPELLTRARSMMALAEDVCPPRHVLRVFDVMWETDAPTLAGIPLPGKMAQAMLEGCPRAAILVCTLGAGYERTAARLRHSDAGDMLLFDGCASALVEKGCDDAMEQLRAATAACLTDRFSPGYGDLPLTIQRRLVDAADAPRRLGVTVNDSALLLPQKTVTAIVGLADSPRPARIRGCAHCALQRDCPYRKSGGSCRI